MTEIEPILESALRAHEQDDVKKAFDLYGRALAAIPDYHHPANKPGDAGFGRLLPLADPEIVDAVIERLSYGEDGSYSEDDLATGTILQAGFLRLAGDPIAAIALCREVMKTTPVTALSALTLGLAYVDMQAFDDAVAMLSDGVSRFPDNASLRNYLGGAQRDASQFNAAIESFRLAGGAGLIIAQVNLGAMLREAGKTREAIEVFRNLLAQNVDAPKIAHNIYALR
jgi:predicted Zn-dependent protease